MSRILLTAAVCFISANADRLSAQETPNLDAISSKVTWGQSCPDIEHKYETSWKRPIPPLRFLPKEFEGKRVLFISGKFTAGDSDRLRTFLSSSGPFQEVLFDSGGGDASEGPKVGLVIREARLRTRVSAGYACISSCSMAFLGGVLRQIDAGAIYGLHSTYLRGGLDIITSRLSEADKRNTYHQLEMQNAQLAGQIQIYGQRMGIRRTFFPEVMFKQRSIIEINDARLGAMRKKLLAAHSIQDAKAYTEKLINDGIILFNTESEKQIANAFLRWMTTSHSQDEVDGVLGSFFQSFKCITKSELEYYNVTNVVSSDQ